MKTKIFWLVFVLMVLVAVSAASAYFMDRAKTVSSAHVGNVQIDVDFSGMEKYLEEDFPFETVTGGD